MAKAAVFLPGSIPEEIVRNRLGLCRNIETVYIDQVSNVDVRGIAQRLDAEGCDLFIARGLQAQMIREITVKPVVPLRITAQEIGLLVKMIQRELGRQDLNIGLVGSETMFNDVNHFDELFGVQVKNYIFQDVSGIPGAIDEAVKDGMDALIGGRHCCEKAKEKNISAWFASGGIDGLDETLEKAQQIAELTDIKVQDAAEMSAIFDYNFNGIMQVSRNYEVLRANIVMLNILNRDSSEVIGRKVTELVPEIELRRVRQAMNGDEEVYSEPALIESVSYAVNISPIKLNGRISSVILTFQEGRRIREMDQEVRREMTRRGHFAVHTFDMYQWQSESMRSIVQTAVQTARTNIPVMICGERGVEKTILAECIHNESMQRNNTFIEADCYAWPPDKLDEVLFGTPDGQTKETPLAEMAMNGTLYLKNVDKLSQESQYKLRMLIRGRLILNGGIIQTGVDVRIIVSSEMDLAELVRQGQFRSDLYYELSIIRLNIEPLRRRREDIMMYVRSYMAEYQKKYERYVKLTAGAETEMLEYDWPGNRQQLNNVCHRIVLLSKGRSVDELSVRLLLDETSPDEEVRNDAKPAYHNAEAEKIISLLEKHHGSREKVAKELGISKPTLWRHMKKYGIQD